MKCHISPLLGSLESLGKIKKIFCCFLLPQTRAMQSSSGLVSLLEERNVPKNWCHTSAALVLYPRPGLHKIRYPGKGVTSQSQIWQPLQGWAKGPASLTTASQHKNHKPASLTTASQPAQEQPTKLTKIKTQIIK